MADIQGMLRDPEYQALPFAERRQLLSEADPEFKSAPASAQVQIMNEMKQQDWWQGGVNKRKAVQVPQEVPLSTKFMANPVMTTGRAALGAIEKLIPGKQADEETANQVIDVLKGAYNQSFIGRNLNNASKRPTLAELSSQSLPSPEQQREMVGQNLGWAFGGDAAKGARSFVGKGASETIADLPAFKAKRSDDKIAKLFQQIDDNVNKAIRPGVEGKRTFAQQESFRGKARDAVKNIVMNRENLQLTDEFGEVVSGLPKNLRQFSQAVDQTKSAIYRQFDDLAKQSGQQGAVVDLNPIANELRSVANDSQLKTLSPEISEYALKKAQSLNKTGKFTAQEAQEGIANLNRSLEAFYKNPSYDTASKAHIDALIVNNMRKGLDDAIETATGQAGYQELKNAYGSLKAVERDVNRRALVDARKNAKGLLDFSDIFTSGEVVRGIISMNPASVGAGVTSKMIASLYKLGNDPNRQVAKLFKNTDKLVSSFKPTKLPLPAQNAPASNPNLAGWGKINTVDLPVGEATRFDRTIGANIPVNNSSQVMKLSDLMQANPTFFDRTIGAKIPRKQ